MLAAVLGVLRDAGSSIWVLGDAGSSTGGTG
jgi:hypothetical protein